MMTEIDELLEKEYLDKNDLIRLLNADKSEAEAIFKKSSEIKQQYIGNKTYFRGLIEYSNICEKNCYYCGIRKGNKNVQRYKVTKEEVLEAAKFAYDNKYASVVLQSGEISSPAFTKTIAAMLEGMMELSNNELGITLSCGEQTEETYKLWYDKGATRYLLRIETSNRELYYKLHPEDTEHNYEERLNCLKLLKKVGYQVGTGVMIGLPFQTIEDLADDLLFMREFDIDMCGMGPYIEHHDTPLYEHRDMLMSKDDRFFLSLKMVALLRILMKDINIAATTAMQTLDKLGREKAIKVGANIVMPNLTPVKYRDEYLLYEDKPCTTESPEECRGCLEVRIKIAGDDIGYGEWGDSKHFAKRTE
jgi:biotin synthase